MQVIFIVTFIYIYNYVKITQKNLCQSGLIDLLTRYTGPQYKDLHITQSHRERGAGSSQAEPSVLEEMSPEGIPGEARSLVASGDPGTTLRAVHERNS